MLCYLLQLFDGSTSAAGILDEAEQSLLTQVNAIARYDGPGRQNNKTTKQVMKTVGFYCHQQQHRRGAIVSSQLAVSSA